MNATKRESHPVKWVTLNSKELTARPSLKDCLIVSTLGNLLCPRQLPDSWTCNKPDDVRSTNRFGLEAVWITSYSVSARGLSVSWVCRVVHQRIVPAAGWYDPFNLSRPPRLWFVFINRRAGFQHWINDAPGFLNIILSRKQRCIPRHRVPQHPFVRVHFLGTGMAAGQQLR